MKQVAILIIFILTAANAFANSLIVPKVDLEYAAPFDFLVCPQIEGSTPVTDQMKMEFGQLLPTITKKWNKSNEQFWKEIYITLGKNYPDRELKVSLTLCSKFPGGIISPLMINASYFIKVNPDKPTAPLYFLTNLIFHEMLHIFLIHHYPSTIEFTSPLLVEYKDEDIMVKMHLHLFSLQYAVYKSLSRESELLQYIQMTANISPHFVRAWEIIDSRGIEAFLEELK